MKKVFAVILAVAVVLSLGATVALAAKPGSTDTTFNGNGAPSGAHYNLNIIGVPKDKSADMDGNNGHRIFVDLEGKIRILLAEGDFAVLDANGTDGVAEFQLPNPDEDGDGVTSYSVYVRALGKPNGSATIQSGFIDEYGTEWLSAYVVTVERSKGKSVFTNVSKELLFVYCDIDADGNLERIPLFDDRGEQYFWDYDNNGCKLVQMRFYEIPSGPYPDEVPIV